MTHKTCSRCGEAKPTSAFHRDAHAPDGYRPTCKGCRNPVVREQQREYQRQPGAKERRREYMREYLERPGVREKYREWSRKYNERVRQIRGY